MVVGVHSGKFTGERDTAHIRDAAIRLNAIHATVNDRQFRVWRSFAVNAWPTLVAIDPRGYVVGTHAGEFTADALAPFVERVIAEARSAGNLTSGSLHFPADAPAHAPGELAYPGKVTARDHRIAIADSGHGRVLVGTLGADGVAMRVERIVSGFVNPQGMAFTGDALYVADPGSHRISVIALGDGSVRVIAGTGHQARTRRDLAGGAMSSPWDLALSGETLFVAMAGIHQLWSLDLRDGTTRVHSGSGAEALHDGAHAEAALAQPMGLCAGDSRIYFTDSESSAVRVADADPLGRVSTVVGTGLFDFGDVDGAGDDVRLQHPQGIAHAGDGRLLIADSYNGSLKWIDERSRFATTWIRGLDEPGGIALTSNHVYVAETNRHRVAVIDRSSGKPSDLALRF